MHVGVHREGSDGNSAEGHLVRVGEAGSGDLNAHAYGTTRRSEAGDLGKHAEVARCFQGGGSRGDGDGTGGRAAGHGGGEVAVGRNREACGSTSEEDAAGSVEALTVDSNGRAHFPARRLREEGGVGWQAEVQTEERSASGAGPATGAGAATGGFTIENAVGRLGEGDGSPTGRRVEGVQDGEGSGRGHLEEGSVRVATVWGDAIEVSVGFPGLEPMLGKEPSAHPATGQKLCRTVRLPVEFILKITP